VKQEVGRRQNYCCKLTKVFKKDLLLVLQQMVAKQHSIHYPITIANAMAASAHNPRCHCQCHGCSICRHCWLIVACCFRTFYFLMAPVTNCAARAAAIPLLLFHVAVTIAMLVGNVAAI